MGVECNYSVDMFVIKTMYYAHKQCTKCFGSILRLEGGLFFLNLRNKVKHYVCVDHWSQAGLEKARLCLISELRSFRGRVCLIFWS